MCELSSRLYKQCCPRLPFGCWWRFCNNDCISVIWNLSRKNLKLRLRSTVKENVGAICRSLNVIQVIQYPPFVYNLVLQTITPFVYNLEFLRLLPPPGCTAAGRVRHASCLRGSWRSPGSLFGGDPWWWYELNLNLKNRQILLLTASEKWCCVIRLWV